MNHLKEVLIISFNFPIKKYWLDGGPPTHPAVETVGDNRDDERVFLNSFYDRVEIHLSIGLSESLSSVLGHAQLFQIHDAQHVSK